MTKPEKIYLIRPVGGRYPLNAFTNKKDAEEYLEILKNQKNLEYRHLAYIEENEINNKEIIW